MNYPLEMKYFFNDDRDDKELIIKDSPEDFIVQEITTDKYVCGVEPIINLERYIKSIRMLIYLFKEERTEEEIEEWIRQYENKYMKKPNDNPKDNIHTDTSQLNGKKFNTNKVHNTNEDINTNEEYNANDISTEMHDINKAYNTNDNTYIIEDHIKSLKSEYENIKFIPLNINSKDLRTKIHKELNFNLSVTTKTIDDKLIIKKSLSNTYNFALKKVMMNTVDACKMIERNLGTSVSFAGNKDKKAVTYQRVSCKCNINTLLDFAYEYTDCTQEDLKNIKIYKFIEGIEINEEELQVYNDEEETKRHKSTYIHSSIGIYNITRGHSIKLGDLKGNKFTIRIKNRTSLKYKNIENGFINYYGEQRFGKAGNNHAVGEKILNKEYKEAIDLILRNSKGYQDFIEGNHEECLKKCDNMERYFFKNLINQKEMNYKKIIFGMRREIRMIYLHSYQSYLFNKEVNEFIKTKQSVFEQNVIEQSIKECDEEQSVTEQSTKENKKAEQSLQGCEIDLLKDTLELRKMNDKLLKGGIRKIFEKGRNVTGWQDGPDFVISFELNSSCYATMALREL